MSQTNISEPYVKGIQRHIAIRPDRSAAWAGDGQYPHSIKTIESFAVRPRWALVRVETTGGVVGWGEATLEGHSEAVEGSLKDIARRITELMAKAYPRSIPIFIAIDFTVEGRDIKGKVLGVPVWELLGGKVRERCEIYTHIAGDTVDDFRENAKLRKEQGYRKVKMPAVANEVAWLDSPALLNENLSRFKAIKEAGLDVAIDFHGRLHRGMAKQLVKLLEPHQPFFVEEPLLPGHITEFKDLIGQTSVPIALGERLYTRLDVRPYLEASCMDIIQPDLAHAGGITEVRKIAAMAEAYDVGLAPHCPIGPLGMAACLHVGFSTPSFVIQEVIIGSAMDKTGFDLYTYMLNPDFLAIKDGHVSLFDRPGLGVDIDEAKVRQEAGKAIPFKNDVVRGENGEVREW
ncbi:hypothetical protein EHS25_004718 [Saitozyma podzolica]|uniref:Mandelate racemase/muconate lactonizing enzyme C-terminal domain-containing protein n=1 Tax=Saitozyma podzolica TaxID=1890683 RepID=A0A427YV00_9TREE|nr:hypothetical protein EHS25_004718 [Saitozyma podzolica]